MRLKGPHLSFPQMSWHCGVTEEWQQRQQRKKKPALSKIPITLSGKALKEEHGLLYVEIGQSDFEQRRRNHMGHCIISGNSQRASVV